MYSVINYHAPFEITSNFGFEMRFYELRLTCLLEKKKYYIVPICICID